MEGQAFPRGAGTQGQGGSEVSASPGGPCSLKAHELASGQLDAVPGQTQAVVPVAPSIWAYSRGSRNWRCNATSSLWLLPPSLYLFSLLPEEMCSPGTCRLSPLPCPSRRFPCLSQICGPEAAHTVAGPPRDLCLTGPQVPHLPWGQPWPPSQVTVLVLLLLLSPFRTQGPFPLPLLLHAPPISALSSSS